jgi:uncharacterized membrane protein YqgA involved in biofilm formation
LSQRVIGSILNAAGILVGGIAGLVRREPIGATTQNLFKRVLGALILFYGFRLTWLSVSGPLGHLLKQLAAVFLAMVLGKITGRLLRLQNASNRLGRFARARINAARPDDPNRVINGFLTCSALYCASPLGVLGSITDGLPPAGAESGYFYPLAVKAVMDGLATLGFVSLFGWGAMLSAVPVLVFQGTLTLACAHFLLPPLETWGLVDAVNAVCGVLLFSMLLIIFEVRRFEATNYLPSLVMAPLLWHWIV